MSRNGTKDAFYPSIGNDDEDDGGDGDGDDDDDDDDDDEADGSCMRMHPGGGGAILAMDKPKGNTSSNFSATRQISSSA